MILQLFGFLFLINFSLEASVELFTALEDNDGSLAVSFLENMIKRYKLDKELSKMPSTLESDFYHLMDLLKPITIAQQPSIFQESLDRIGSNEYYPLIEGFALSHTREFLQIVINSKISFQMLFINDYGFTELYLPEFFVLDPNSRLLLSGLIDCIRVMENGPSKEGNEKETYFYMRVKGLFCNSGFQLYEQGIVHHLGKPLISTLEWEERKEIVNLFLKLSTMLKFFTELDWAYSLNLCISMQNSRYQLLLDHISIINENEIDFQGLWVVYKRVLINASQPDEVLRFQNIPRPTIYTHPCVNWLSILSFYMHHFLISNFTQMEISRIDVGFLSLTVLYWRERCCDQLLKFLLLNPQEQIKQAIQKIEKEIIFKFDEAHKKFPLFKKYIHASKSSDQSQIQKTKSFLKNYADDVFDKNDCQLELNKRLVKIYFRLLLYQENPQMIPK
jgi:hypothetical protein